MSDARLQVPRSDHGPDEHALLDARAARRAEPWHAWEVARIAAIVRWGDTVLELGEAVAALAGGLAGRAGWVFAAATDDPALGAQCFAFDLVRPRNLTLAPLSQVRSWCGSAEVVVAADWSPTTEDHDAELGSLVEMTERALVVTGWRSLSPSTDDVASGAELALAFARRHGLEAQIRSMPIDDTRLRTVVIVEMRPPRP